MSPKKDHISAIIISVIIGCGFLMVLGFAIEVLKFVALVKWVFG